MIGGLIFATAATLLFVPVVFSILHGRAQAPEAPPAPPPRDPEKPMPDQDRTFAPLYHKPASCCSPDARLEPLAPAGVPWRSSSAVLPTPLRRRPAATPGNGPRNRRYPGAADHPARVPAWRRLPPCPATSRPSPARHQCPGFRAIQKWFADIGAPVRQGQLLAQIDPPSL